ncbi:unnamed protein product, partial [Mesorhabditis belari]|uniref:PARP catalytic domain-containing protein n=1 Tax=Mesorhabditis belari TaxID=2138241 RepID=A0AAF3FBK0_9BILA
MPKLSIEDEALRVGINYHMCRLKNEPFDPDPEAIADFMIVQPRELFFDVNTIKKAAVSKMSVQEIRAKHKPKFNYDFTKILIDQQPFSRGGALYTRPLGSMRYALAVLDKYGDNVWLGTLRQSANSSIDGEWSVAYHGTTDPRAAEIVRSGGLDLKEGKRFLFGHGIYCTPDPKTALAYASTYHYDGKTYKLIVQARVDPSRREIVPKSKHGVANLDDYWIAKENDAIRPYGICVFPC